jgi:hypothetical protein
MANPVSINDIWMLLGEKDVQIFQLLKTLEAMRTEIEQLRKEKDNGGLEHPSTN